MIKWTPFIGVTFLGWTTFLSPNSSAQSAVTVNWGGSEPVSIEEWCTYLAELTGTEARFEPTAHTIDSVQIDTTRMHELIGPTTVPWRDGMRRMAKALHPDLVK